MEKKRRAKRGVLEGLKSSFSTPSGNFHLHHSCQSAAPRRLPASSCPFPRLHGKYLLYSLSLSFSFSFFPQLNRHSFSDLAHWHRHHEGRWLIQAASGRSVQIELCLVQIRSTDIPAGSSLPDVSGPSAFVLSNRARVVCCG